MFQQLDRQRVAFLARRTNRVEPKFHRNKHLTVSVLAREKRRNKTGKEQTMAWITRSLVAFGLFGAMAAATPTPTLAQGVHFEGRGFGVDIGRPDYRYHRGYRNYAWERGRGCRTVTIERDDGSVRRIRRCD
jgi:hypothetical protein